MTLPHHSLLAWQRADDLFIELRLLSRTFPPVEKYELGSQLRRSAFSVPVNIVESSSRYTNADKLHFLQVALASLAEAGYCLHAARRLQYIDDKQYQRLDSQVRRTAAPLRGLMKSLGRAHP